MENKNIDLIMVVAGTQGPKDKMHVPLGLLYVGSELERNGYNIKIWHLLPAEFDSVIPAIKLRKSLWIGISVLSGMSTLYAAQLSIKLKREIPGVPLVWGGHHPSAVPDECLKESYIDFVICGEGEETAVEFSKALESQKTFNGITGFGYKALDGTPVVNQARAFQHNLDKYEIHWDLLDLKNYYHKNFHGKAPINFYSSRGCPYACTFCATPFYTGKSYRTHSPEFVEKNLRYLYQNYGFNSVFFGDDNFMIKADRGVEIIKRLRSIGISVDTVDVRINQINEKMLKDFKENSVSGIFFGYESGNDRILELMQKGITVADIKEKVLLIKQFSITTWASGMIGVPTETREEIYRTIDFTMWLRDNLPPLSAVAVGRYIPLPKTKLIELAIKHGFTYPQNTEDWKKIDPKGPEYSMKSWLPWINDDDEKYFAIVQELSIYKMLDFASSSNFVANAINNWLVRTFRNKIAKRKTSLLIHIKIFGMLRSLYSLMVSGQALVKGSKALKRFKIKE
jgi:anaerobic magnesium-protoporphyrin IX monomethyl ester cyclase